METYMQLYRAWLFRWAMRGMLVFVAFVNVTGFGAARAQAQVSERESAQRETEATRQREVTTARGALDPLNRDEQAVAERLARSEPRVKEALGETGVRLVSALPVLIKSGESHERIDPHQRLIEVVLFHPQREIGTRVVLDLGKNRVVAFQKLESAEVPMTVDDLSDAFQLALRDAEVVKALDPEFLEAGRASTQINYPGAAPLSITNVSKARDYIGQVIVTAIQGGNVKAALNTAYDGCVELLKEERAKKS